MAPSPECSDAEVPMEGGQRPRTLSIKTFSEGGLDDDASTADLSMLLSLMECMRPPRTDATEAVLAECIGPQPSTEEAAIPHMPVLAEGGRMFSNQQLTQVTSVWKLLSLSDAFYTALQGRRDLSVDASTTPPPPPPVEWSCSGVVVWIGKAREFKFGRRCVLVKLSDFCTEQMVLFVGDAADAFVGGWPGPSHSLFTTHYATHYPLSTHHSPLTTYYSPLATHHSPLSLLTSRYSLLATRYTTHYSLLTVHFSCIPRSKSWEWRYVLPRACRTDPQRDRTGTQIQYGSWCHPCQVCMAVQESW